MKFALLSAGVLALALSVPAIAAQPPVPAGCHDNLKDKKGTNSLYYVVHAKEKADAPLKHQSCLSCHVKVVAEKPDLKKELTGCAKSKCHP